MSPMAVLQRCVFHHTLYEFGAVKISKNMAFYFLLISGEFTNKRATLYNFKKKKKSEVASWIIRGLFERASDLRQKSDRHKPDLYLILL